MKNSMLPPKTPESKGFTLSRHTPLLIPEELALTLQWASRAADQIWDGLITYGNPEGQNNLPNGGEESNSQDDLRTPLSDFSASVIAQAVGLTIKPTIRKSKFSISVYELKQVKAVKTELTTKTADKDRVKQRTALLDHMITVGPLRKLAQPSRTWQIQFEGLARDFPNFCPVVDFLRAEFALCKNARRPLAFSPIAVHGPPGIGKSVFLDALNAVLGTTYKRIQAETSQHSAAIGGTAKHWANSEVGSLFDAIVMGKNANPLFYIDEIDKADHDGQRSITAVLYSLLEQTSARKFLDASLPEIEIDASHVQWVFAANDIEKVPAAIRSRWVEFRISPMKRDQVIHVIQRIYADLQKMYRVTGLKPLSTVALNFLSRKSPREIKSLLRQAIAASILDGHEEITFHFAAEATESNRKGTEIPRLIIVGDMTLEQLTSPLRVLH